MAPCPRRPVLLAVCLATAAVAVRLRAEAPGHTKKHKHGGLQDLISAMKEPEFLKDSPTCAKQVTKTMSEIETEYTDVQVSNFLSYVCENYKIAEEFGGQPKCTE